MLSGSIHGQFHRIITVIFAVIFIVCLTSLCFAEDSVTGVEILAPDVESNTIYKMASDIKAATNTTYDIDDIYYILNACYRYNSSSGNEEWQVHDTDTFNALMYFDGNSYNSAAELLHDISAMQANGLFDSTATPYLLRITNTLNSIQGALYGPAWDGSGVTNSLWNALQTLYSVNHADQLAQMTKQQGIIDALVGNTQYSLSYKLDTLHSDLSSYNWSNSQSFDIYGMSSSLSLAYSQSYDITGATKEAYVRISPILPLMSISQLTFPRLGSNVSIEVYNFGQTLSDTTVLSFQNGWQNILYFIPLSRMSQGNGNSDLILHIKSNEYFIASGSGSYKYIDFGTKDYFNLLSELSTIHIDSDLHSLSDTAERFKQLYASDDLVAAKQAQQGYEDNALSDFTGSGSAAASVSDQAGIKQVSGSLKSGLNTGVSVSNGLSVFSNQTFWSWFSQSNSDAINNLYVPNSRSDTKSFVDYEYNPNAYEDNLRDIQAHQEVSR